MEFKGTKGKWIVKYGDVYSEFKDDGGIICDIYTYVAEEAEANALLISKAPEMLEMLKEIKSRLKGNGFPSLTAMVEQLIKEATEI